MTVLGASDPNHRISLYIFVLSHSSSKNDCHKEIYISGFQK